MIRPGLLSDIRLASEKARLDVNTLANLADQIEDYFAGENARLTRRVERVSAREERFLDLCDRLEVLAKQATTEAEDPDVLDEFRLRRYGVSEGLRMAASMIRETYK